MGDLPGSFGSGKRPGASGGNLTVCWAAEMQGSQVASLNLGWQGDGLHIASPIHHSQPIFVVFQMEESVFSRPNHRGRRSQAIRAGVEHPIPNTETHGESGPEK